MKRILLFFSWFQCLYFMHMATQRINQSSISSNLKKKSKKIAVEKKSLVNHQTMNKPHKQSKTIFQRSKKSKKKHLFCTCLILINPTNYVVYKRNKAIKPSSPCMILFGYWLKSHFLFMGSLPNACVLHCV